MAVLIVLLHSTFEYELRDGISIFEGIDAPFYHHLDYMFVKNVCNIAVPLFFVISGYLFFYKDQGFTSELYKNKIKKRAKSLLLPYLIWNLMILVLYIIIQNVAPSMNSGRTKLVLDFTFNDFISCFWSMEGVNGMATPIDGPLWFIRDLMVMIILSPLFFFVINRFKIIVPIILLALYILGVPLTSFCFFSIGAYFGICKVDFVSFVTKYVKFLSTSYIIVLFFLILLMDRIVLPENISLLEIVIGVFASIGIAGCYCKKGIRANNFLAGSTFFIFASHSEILKIFIRLSSRYGPSSDVFYCISYFICPLVTILILISAYWGLRRYFPQVASVLSGGR